jgi:hypothetical protein
VRSLLALRMIVPAVATVVAAVAPLALAEAQQPAQSGQQAPAKPAVPQLSRDEIAAFAKVHIAVSAARDSIQAQLAAPRNKTRQAQDTLHEKLRNQVEQIIHHGGMSNDDFRRKTFVVSTDSVSRRLFDSTVAKLTGQPIPGQVAAAPVIAVPQGPVGVHLGHVLNSFGDTPNNAGLLPTALAEANVARQHATLGARDPNNLDAMKLHAGHVIHALDPTIVTAGPGRGYGLKKAALGAATHTELAAKTPGASPNVVTHANHVGTSARNVVTRADQILALAKQVQAATVAADAAKLMAQMISLSEQLIAGADANGDGRITWQEGEGGLQHAAEHLDLLIKGESQS